MAADNINKAMIDEMLDMYNDYIALYKNFGDEEYMSMASACLITIKNHMKPKRRVKARVIAVKGKAD